MCDRCVEGPATAFGRKSSLFAVRAAGGRVGESVSSSLSSTRLRRFGLGSYELAELKPDDCTDDAEVAVDDVADECTAV